MSPAYRVFPKVFGNTMDSHELFMDRLKSDSSLREAHSENDCDVLIGFVPIVSRAGTDIQAALEKIPAKHSYKRIVLVVLHHTFDPHYIAPDSKYSVTRGDVFPVDCLYYEDLGLLYCKQNDEALKSVITHLGAEKRPCQVADQRGPGGVKTIDVIIAVISIILVYLVLPEAYSSFTFLFTEIFLLVIMSVTLTQYYSLQLRRNFYILALINVVLLFRFRIQTSN